jgi:hypothetical protein
MFEHPYSHANVSSAKDNLPHNLSDNTHYHFDAEQDGSWTPNETDEYLPHIPLTPFRNQVGGHSAIYKFTKRAVCKVSSSFESCNSYSSDKKNSHWSRVKIFFMNPLKEKHHLCCPLSPVTLE